MQYGMLGINLSNRSTEKLPLSARVFVGFIYFGCVLTSQLMYISYVAEGFMDYMQAICAASSTVIIFVCFAAIAFREATLFESIERIEQLIEISESHFDISVYYQYRCFYAEIAHFRM